MPKIRTPTHEELACFYYNSRAVPRIYIPGFVNAHFRGNIAPEQLHDLIRGISNLIESKDVAFRTSEGMWNLCQVDTSMWTHWRGFQYFADLELVQDEYKVILWNRKLLL